MEWEGRGRELRKEGGGSTEEGGKGPEGDEEKKEKGLKEGGRGKEMGEGRERGKEEGEMGDDWEGCCSACRIRSIQKRWWLTPVPRRRSLLEGNDISEEPIT